MSLSSGSRDHFVRWAAAVRMWSSKCCLLRPGNRWGSSPNNGPALEKRWGQTWHQYSLSNKCSSLTVGLHWRWQLRNQLPARPGCEGNLVDFYNVILFWTISFILGESHLAGSIILNWLHVLWDSKSEPGQPLLDIEYWTFWYTYIGRWAFWYFLNYFKCVAI